MAAHWAPRRMDGPIAGAEYETMTELRREHAELISLAARYTLSEGNIDTQSSAAPVPASSLSKYKTTSSKPIRYLS